MLASNELWVVPAGLESRRFFVLDVGDAHANDHPYFAAIIDELEHGGYEAMLYELLNRDISQSNLRLVPVTDALIDQRKLSLGPTERWWVDCLSRGFVFISKHGLEDHFEQWHPVIATKLLFDSYTAFCQTHRERHTLSREDLGKWLHTKGYKPVRPGGMVVTGEHLVDATTTTTAGTGSSSPTTAACRNSSSRIARAAMIAAA